MARATGIGSLPGDDFTEWVKVALGEVDLPFLPELPARGVHASMVGRTLGLIADLGADLQPDGWRIGVGQGVDQRRARSLLAHDLDVSEELGHELDGPFKVQVAGPLTLAASVEHPRGDKVLADHGARRELTEAFTIGLASHAADVRRRFPLVDLVVQVDEPGLRAVLDGTVRTASGYRTHRSLEPSEVDAHLRPVVETIVAGGATPVVHACATGVPVDLLRGAGFRAISFDLSLTGPADQWAEAWESGVDLWTGTTPDDGAAGRVERFFGALGYAPESFADRVVVSAPCGLADSTPAAARASLSATSGLARRLAGDQPR